MNLGFDLDGVLVTQNVSRLIEMAKNNVSLEVEIDYYKQQVPQMDPRLFASKDDQLFIITSRRKELKEITFETYTRYFPYMKLVLASMEKELFDPVEQAIEVAMAKAKMIDNHKIDVYFEDIPQVAKHLRNLCPDCTIIQYGGK